MDTLLFATAGIPHKARGETTQDAIPLIKKMGLSAMELEFVHSVNISRDKAPIVAKAAKESGIVLTCHAPYFINLNSLEAPKLKASMQRILQSARILDLCGGYSVCFHPGFYQKSTKEEAYNRVLDAMKEIVKTAKDEGLKVWLRPETTGKASQFGDIDELLQLSAEFDSVMPCIDFSHLHARENGKQNTLEEFRVTLGKVEKTLGKKGLQNMHCHVAGIAYSEKGEKHHLNLGESDFDYKNLMKALAEFKVRGVLVCESPNIEEDALLMQKEFRKHK